MTHIVITELIEARQLKPKDMEAVTGGRMKLPTFGAGAPPEGLTHYA
jgi:hypothetical protein